MSKTTKRAKASEPAEGSRSVSGKSVAENAPVEEHGNPAPSGQLVTITEHDFSIVFPDTITKDQFEDKCRAFGQGMQGVSWKVGDLANFGKAKFGYKDYATICDLTGLAEVYVRQCSSLAQRVESQFRHLASLERFRLLLPKREKILVPTEGSEAKAERLETIPELVARFNDWTALQLRAGTQEPPKQLSAADTGSAAGSPEAGGSAGDAEPETPAPDAGAAPANGAPEKITPSATAGAVWNTLLLLDKQLETLNEDRIAMLATYEKNNMTIGRVVKMLELLNKQVVDFNAKQP